MLNLNYSIPTTDDEPFHISESAYQLLVDGCAITPKLWSHDSLTIMFENIS